MAGQQSDLDRKLRKNLNMPGPLSDKDIEFMQRAAPKAGKRKFVPGEIYSAKGKTGRS